MPTRESVLESPDAEGPGGAAAIDVPTLESAAPASAAATDADVHDSVTVEDAVPDGSGSAPPAPDPGSPASQRRRRSKRARLARRWAAAAAVVAPIVVVALGFWLSRGDAARLPPSLSIDGVEVGGLSVEDARARLEAHVAELTAKTVTFRLPQGRLVVDGERLGIAGRIDDALATARGERGRWSRLLARLGISDTIDVPLEFEVSKESVDKVVRDVARRVDRRGRSARLRVNADGVAVVPAANGRRVDRERLRELLSQVPEPETVAVPVEETPPAVDDEDGAEAKVAVERLLRPTTITIASRRAKLDVETLREALELGAKDGEITIDLNPAVLGERLAPAFGRFERQPRDAGFVIDDQGEVEILPHKNGRVLDTEALARTLIARTDSRPVPIALREQAPSITTRFAEAMGIEEVVSEFTTQYPCCAPRVTNIKRAAAILDGTVVKPGGRFSLNETLGQRTRAKGFVKAPMIERGRLKDAVGGGVSQVATTTYNAAFFAGVELVDHTPHEFYISRYPMGREATVSWPDPDLVFRNDWPAGILIEAIATDTSITVRFWSSRLGRKVTTKTGEPFDYVDPKTIREFNGALPVGSTKVVQDGGNTRGFTVRYTRVVTREGKRIKNERWTWRYKPEDTIVQVGPTPPPRPRPKPAPAPAAPTETPAETTG